MPRHPVFERGLRVTSEFDIQEFSIPAEESVFIQLKELDVIHGGEMELNIDKLTDEYTLRIPECTKRRIDRLSKSQRKLMNDAILISIAEFLHECAFDARRYLVEDYDTRTRSAT